MKKEWWIICILVIIIIILTLIIFVSKSSMDINFLNQNLNSSNNDSFLLNNSNNNSGQTCTSDSQCPNGMECWFGPHFCGVATQTNGVPGSPEQPGNCVSACCSSSGCKS